MNYKEFFKKIDAEIKKADSIVILRHESPDPDAIGSQVGLREIIRATYPEKTVYLLGEMPSSLTYWTVRIHRVLTAHLKLIHLK